MTGAYEGNGRTDLIVIRIKLAVEVMRIFNITIGGRLWMEPERIGGGIYIW